MITLLFIMTQKQICKLSFVFQNPGVPNSFISLVLIWKIAPEDWIKKMWYIYRMEYYSTIKKKGIMPFEATWMNLDSAILREIRQRRRNIMESKKK